MLGRQLQRVDHAEDLVEVAPGRHRVDEDQLDLLVRAYDEDVPHGLVVSCGAVLRLASDLGGKHPVELRDAEVRVTDDRIVGRTALRLLDVLGPSRVIAGRVDRQPDDLHVAAVEFGLDVCHVPELRRAHGREVLRMREEHSPRVADPVVEADRALGRLGREVRCGVADRQSHRRPPSRACAPSSRAA